MQIKSRTRFHSREQIVAGLREALEVVVELDLPAELREAAFTKAAELVMQAHLELEPTAIGTPLMQIPQAARH